MRGRLAVFYGGDFSLEATYVIARPDAKRILPCSEASGGVEEVGQVSAALEMMIWADETMAVEIKGDTGKWEVSVAAGPWSPDRSKRSVITTKPRAKADVISSEDRLLLAPAARLTSSLVLSRLSQRRSQR